MSVEVLEMPEADAKLAPITKVKTEIAKLRKEYAGLTIKDINDKEGFLKVSTARKSLKALRSGVENERKSLNEDALKWQRQVNGAAKEITAEILEMEEPLQTKEDWYLAEKERIKAEEERLRKEKITNRATVITSFQGVTFNGLSYLLGEFKIDHSDLEKLPDDKFQTKVEELEAEYQTLLTARLETERIAKEEADKLETQRKEQENKAAELKIQEDKIIAEREKLEAEKAQLAATQLPSPPAVSFVPNARESTLVTEPASVKKVSKGAAVAGNLLRSQDLQMFNDMTANVRILVGKYSFNTTDGKKALEDFNTGIELLIKSSILNKPE